MHAVGVFLLVSLCYDVFYINLDHRHDRNAAIIHELRGQNITNATRVAAVRPHKRPGATPQQRGLLGCSLSHVMALNRTTHSVALVFEDDLMFVRPFRTLELALPSFEWDVLVFAYNGRLTHPCYVGRSGNSYCKVDEVQTTSMYAVRKTYIPHLLGTLNRSIVGLLANKRPEQFAGDQTWKVLQRTPGHHWYGASPRIGIQRPGYSDIKQSVENYGV